MVFRYKTSTIKAAVYYKHPSGERAKFTGPDKYEVDEQEYVRLEQAFLAFEQGRSEQASFSLRLANKDEIVLRLDEIWAVLQEPRELISE